VNPPLKGTRYIPDFLWPGPRLILEADSRRFHTNIIARADDATRQLVLETMGLRVIRTTWREATTRPSVVQRRIADALAAPVG
jgi:very-short-patch-repair endonuclease